MWNVSARAAENEMSQLVFRRANSSLTQLILALHSGNAGVRFFTGFFIVFCRSETHLFYAVVPEIALLLFQCRWWLPLKLSTSCPLHRILFCLPQSPRHEPSAYTPIKMCFPFSNLEPPRDGITSGCDFPIFKNNKIIWDQSRGIRFIIYLQFDFNEKELSNVRLKGKEYIVVKMSYLSPVSIIFRVCGP